MRGKSLSSAGGVFGAARARRPLRQSAPGALSDLIDGGQGTDQIAADNHRLQHRLSAARTFVMQPEQIEFRVAEELFGAGNGVLVRDCSSTV